jgi:hypothetical protein
VLSDQPARFPDAVGTNQPVRILERAVVRILRKKFWCHAVA